MKATSAWRLESGYPGTAHLEFAEMPFSVLDELRPGRVAAEAWPFVGAFQGQIDFRGPATDIEKWLETHSAGWNRWSWHKRLGPFFELAKRRNWVAIDPMENIPIPRTPAPRRTPTAR